MTLAKPKLPILQRGHPFARGLVGAWLAYEGAGATLRDVTGYRNHGSLNGDASWVRTQHGAAISYDGTGDYVEVPSTSILNPGHITIVARAWKSSGFSSGGREAICAKYDNTTNRRQFFLGDPRSDSSALQVAVSTAGSNFRIYSTGVNPFPGWVTVFASYGGTAPPRVWIENEEQSLSISSQNGWADGNLHSSDVAFTIGRAVSQSNEPNYFSGRIESVQLFNWAFDQGDVDRMYPDLYQAFRPRTTHLIAAIDTTTAAIAIDLSWTDNSEDENGFKIERSTDGVSFTQIDTVAATVTSYQDDDAALVGSTTYYYRVRAHNDNGDSDYSNVAEVTTS